mgnify:FL=1
MFTASRRPAPIEGVNQKYVLSDGNRTLDLYPLEGLAHAQTMLIIYLPREKIVINADMYNPAAPGTEFPDFRLPNMQTLAQNIERLNLDVERHVGIHGQTSSHEEFLRAISET